MDPKLFMAAITGNVNVVNQNRHTIKHQLTPDNNTLLHLASISGQIVIVNTILDNSHTNFLLTRINSHGESALHLASRNGHTQVVNKLIEKARELDQDEEIGYPKVFEFFLWMVNEEGDTALHEAVRYHHTKVAMALIGEDSDYSHSSNNYGETPLYIAACRGFVDLVDVILSGCTASSGPVYSGPYSTTALHGAAICKDKKCSQADISAQKMGKEMTGGLLYMEAGVLEKLNTLKKPLSTIKFPPFSIVAFKIRRQAVAIFTKDCMEKLLNSKLSFLAREKDLYGQTPLHYAIHSGCANKASQLLHRDDSAVYVADNDKNTPLHVAASQGNVSIIRKIMSHCPDSCYMVDKKGRNILHIAAVKEKKSAVEFILKYCPVVSYLIVQKDVDGNTPLHLLATTNSGFVKKLVQHAMADKEALNREMFTPTDMVNYTKYDDGHERPKLRIQKELRRSRTSFGYPNFKKMNTMIKGLETEEEDDHIVEEFLPFDHRKIVDNHIIVATLIATVTFAAGFTLPGGYIQSGSENEGKAILTREKAFKLFMIFDTVALICSVIAIVVYSAATDYRTKRKIVIMSRVAAAFGNTGLVAMLLAFVMGIYAVLSHSSAFAIAILVVGCISFPLYICALLKYLWDYITYDM